MAGELFALGDQLISLGVELALSAVDVGCSAGKFAVVDDSRLVEVGDSSPFGLGGFDASWTALDPVEAVVRPPLRLGRRCSQGTGPRIRWVGPGR